MHLTNDFTSTRNDIFSKYADLFEGINSDIGRKKRYCDIVLVERYERIEEILGEYLDLP